jgi:hypothetical protein
MDTASNNPLMHLSCVAMERLLSMPASTTSTADMQMKIHDIGKSLHPSLPRPAIIRSKTTGSIEEAGHKRIYSSACVTDSIHLITEEDRKKLKKKILDSYKQNCESFEDLLGLCVDMEEELLFTSAPTRLDYYKVGVKYESRVEEVNANRKKQTVS